MAHKDFHLGDVLSITTGVLLSPRRMAGVYDILNWMSGDNLFTHQLPRVAREASSVLLRAHPDLATVEKPTLKPDEVDPWLVEQVAKFGEIVAVPKMTADEHESIDPMSELVERVHPDKIIKINVR